MNEWDAVTGQVLPDISKDSGTFTFTGKHSFFSVCLWRWMHYNHPKRRELLANDTIENPKDMNLQR
jgi:hypothetical protein